MTLDNIKNRILRLSKNERGCRIATFGWRHNGYVFVDLDGIPGKTRIGVHRASYQIFNGKIPDGMIIRHKCDVRDCVEPSHLETGTHLENARDCVVRGRTNRCRKISDSQLIRMLAFKKRGMPYVLISYLFGVSLSYVSHLLSDNSKSTRRRALTTDTVSGYI